MQIILFIVGFIGAFTISSHISGHYEGHKRERALHFNVNEYTVHIHHWIWMGILLAMIFYFKVETLFVFGVLMGGILQGLTYRDRFIVFYKTKDFEKIYKKYSNSHWGTHIRKHARIFKKVKL